MILTGSEIKKQVLAKKIIIEPFHEDQVNPNSYNYRIGNEIIKFKVKNGKNIPKFIKIPKKGIILKPHQVYLANTYELLGSDLFAMSLIGRSSLGRLGLFLQVSANLGHTGSIHHWTLELVSTLPIKIYPNMIIGQISFWMNYGDISHHKNGYVKFNDPTTGKVEMNQNDTDRK